MITCEAAVTTRRGLSLRNHDFAVALCPHSAVHIAAIFISTAIVSWVTNRICYCITQNDIVK